MIIIGSLLLAIILVFVSLDGTFLTQKYSSVWSEKYINDLDNDQSKFIAYGIRAASSHNSQPWKVELINSNTIKLYADMDKALNVVDADNKQLLMSQGTFIESYKQAAINFGYEVNVTYSDINFDEQRPLIATIELNKKSNINTEDVISRSTYDAIYLEDYINLTKTLDESISVYPGIKYTIIESSSDVEKLESVLLEATIIESKDEAAAKELLNVFRWTEWEKNEQRYGLSLNTLPVMLKPFIQPIMKSLSGDWEAFGDSGISQFKDRLDKQTKYILLKADNPSDLEYLYSGQIYQNLILEISEYDLRPAMQALENFEAMKSLNLQFQQEYGQDGEVIMIIGLQDKSVEPINSNPRHLVEDIIINQ